MTEFEREYELLSELLLNEQVKDRVNAVLDKIRAEIETLPRELPTDARNMVRKTRVLDIIDSMKGADK